MEVQQDVMEAQEEFVQIVSFWARILPNEQYVFLPESSYLNQLWPEYKNE